MLSFELRISALAECTAVRAGLGILGGEQPLDHPRARGGVLILDAAIAGRPWLAKLAEKLFDEAPARLVVPGGEAAKSPESLVALWRDLSSAGIDRRSRIAVVGGGAVLDLGAFAAATWLRGVECVLVPTTLLAQVDAALGGKCGLNLGGAKNQVGVIRQPALVVVDPEVAATVAEPEWRSGLGEIVKMALLAGGELHAAVASLGRALEPGALEVLPIVAGCLRAKARVVADDPLEAGSRAILNLGHTVAHVLEGLAMAQGKALPHGIAVAAGILAEARALGGSGEVVAAIRALMERQGLPQRLALEWSPDLALRLLQQDKKRRGGVVRVPVLESAGAPRLIDATYDNLLRAASSAAQESSRD